MTPGASRSRRRAFSLVELIGIIAVLAIMAATAMPALHSMADARAAQIVSGVGDALRQARDASVGLGTPCGIRFHRRAQTFELLRADANRVVPLTDALGIDIPARPIDPAGAIQLQAVQGGAVAGANPEIWFDRTGGHTRLVQGSGPVPLRRDATIRFAHGAVLTVRGTTGMVE